MRTESNEITKLEKRGRQRTGNEPKYDKGFGKVELIEIKAKGSVYEDTITITEVELNKRLYTKIRLNEVVNDTKG